MTDPGNPPIILGEMVTVARHNPLQTMTAYSVHPTGTGPFPGLIVIHEVFGLNDDIRQIADSFAGQGYAALAVDLFSNRSRVMCMAQIMYGMIFSPLKNGILADLQAALNHLRLQSGVDPQRTGVIGFCMGGAYALQLACVQDDLKAAAVFYGMNPRPLEVVAKACPVIGSYPDKDFTTKAAVELEAALTRYEVPHDIKIYPKTSHSFYNQGRSFDPHAHADAWNRILAFFGAHLSRSS
jgi:carboxymethylenebutenolidase